MTSSSSRSRALLLLSLHSTSAFMVHSRPLAFALPHRAGLTTGPSLWRPCMTVAAAGDLQAQIDALEAQLKMARLQTEALELERQKPAEPPAAATSAPPDPPRLDSVLPSAPSPETIMSPPPLPTGIPSAPLPVDDVATCATLTGQTVPCQQPEDLVDFGELVGGIKSFGDFSGLPSWQQLLESDTLLPLLGGFVALSIGYVGLTKGAESLRPEDAATTRRKREERERLGCPESVGF